MAEPAWNLRIGSSNPDQQSRWQSNRQSPCVGHLCVVLSIGLQAGLGSNFVVVFCVDPDYLLHHILHAKSPRCVLRSCACCSSTRSVSLGKQIVHYINHIQHNAPVAIHHFVKKDRRDQRRKFLIPDQVIRDQPCRNSEKSTTRAANTGMCAEIEMDLSSTELFVR